MKAKQLGHVKAIAPILDQLNALHFRIAQSTRMAVLKLANEGTKEPPERAIASEGVKRDRPV